MRDVVNWGIIGCGNVVDTKSGPAITSAERSRLVAVMSRDVKKAGDFAERHGARRAYNRVEDLLADPEVDAVYIATPTSLHREQTILAAEAGKHVLCEKPMAMDAAECREMVWVCKMNEVELTVAYYRRCWPVVRKARQLLRDGAMGKSLSAVVQLHSDYVPRDDKRFYWRLDPDIGGGGILTDAGSHRIDLLFDLLGDIISVSGLLDGSLYGIEVDSDASLLLSFAGGTQGMLTCHWGMASVYDRMEVAGTKGRLAIDDLSAGTMSLITPDGVTDFRLPPPDAPHLGLVEAFVACLLDGEPNPLPGDEGMKTTLVLDAAAKSSAEGISVSINYGGRP